MVIFPAWSAWITPELRDREPQKYDDRITEHLINLREFYVPGLTHFWR